MTRFLPGAARAGALLCACLAAMSTLGCGGVGSGGTGLVGTNVRTGADAGSRFAHGTVDGFGSIVVAGVHYDDAGASVIDDDGNSVDAGTDVLRLGSVVDVWAKAPQNGGDPLVTLLQVHTDLVGLVTSLPDATGTLRVLGQPVQVNADTVLDALPGGLADLTEGDEVAVSSHYDPATGVYVATRIDPSADAFAVRGILTGWSPKQGRFMIGSQAFSLGDLERPADIEEGQLVMVHVKRQDETGAWIVSQLNLGISTPPLHAEGDWSGIAGPLTDATHFAVDGMPIDASGAEILPAHAAVTAGARVRVHGAMGDTSWVATSVEIEAADGAAPDAPVPGGRLVIAGPVLAVDPVGGTFSLRGPTTIAYAGASFSGGTAADLLAGRQVEVQGDLSADGTRLVARTIRID